MGGFSRTEIVRWIAQAYRSTMVRDTIEPVGFNERLAQMI